MPSFCVAGVASCGDSHLGFRVAGVALMALGGALGPVLVAGDVVALCVAGMALGNMYLRFTWQAWHLGYIQLRLAWQASRLWHGRRGNLTVARTILSHTSLSHTICHRPSFTHTLSHTNFHTQLCRTPIFTYSHTSLSHTICHRPFFTHTLSHTFDAHYWKKLTCGVIRSFNSGVIEADLGFFLRLVEFRIIFNMF